MVDRQAHRPLRCRPGQCDRATFQCFQIGLQVGIDACGQIQHGFEHGTKARAHDEGALVYFVDQVPVAILAGGTLRDTGPLGELLNPRVDAVELLYDGDDALAAQIAAIDGEHTRTSEGRLAKLADLEQANRAARLVLEGGGRVLSLAPHRQSLEELFLQEARAVAPVEDHT